MKKNTKVWIIIAISLIIIGVIVFGCILFKTGFDFKKLSTTKFETNSYDINEDFKNISIISDTASISFVKSNNARVVCFEEENEKHSVSLNGDTIEIKIENTKKWYENIGISFNTPKITVYIPEGEYGALIISESTGEIEIPRDFTFSSMDIKASTGDIESSASVLGDAKISLSTGDISLENISAKNLNLTVSTGDIELENIKCENLDSNGSTGSISLENVIANGKINIITSTGDVEFERCDGAELIIKTDTGSIKGSLLSEKVFIAQSDTGKVNVPKTENGGKCEITTNTGNIKIVIV